MQRDFLESLPISIVFFGSVLFVAAIIKLVQALLLAVWFNTPKSVAGVLEAGAFLAMFAVGSGCTTAWARRLMRGSRSLKAKNLVTGGVAASWYSGGCYVLFERQSAQGPNWLILGVVLAGIWFAVTGGLNELFS